jgi:cytochrome c553
MTKAQIWVAIFLGVFVILFVVQRALQHETPAPAMSPQTGMSSEPANTESTGESLISELGCINCHGNDLGGTTMAPSLHGLASNYTKEQLVSYLQNPSSQANSDRFKIMREKYRGAMPSFDNRDVHELQKIADVLLGINE